jgi:antitoxin ParD1/3/4
MDDKTEKLSISMPRDLALFIREEVETGDYASTSEAIRDAVRLWRAQRLADRLGSIKDRLNASREHPVRHRAEDVWDRLRQRYRDTSTVEE